MALEIIPVTDGNPLSGLCYMRVGKGKKVHLSRGNDDTLCPASQRGEGRYVSITEGTAMDVCGSCFRIAEKRHAENQRIAYMAARDAELDALSYGVDAPQEDAHTGTENGRELVALIEKREIVQSENTPAPEILSGVTLSADTATVRPEGSDGTPIVPDSAARTADVIMDSDPSSWAPEFDRPEAAECYHGCGSAPVAAFVDAYGVTQGLCAAHRGRVDVPTYDRPDAPQEDAPEVSPTLAMVRAIQSGKILVAAVTQNAPGMVGVTHYHSPACADVKREMRKWGQSESDVTFATFSTVAEILVMEFGDIADGYAEESTPEWWQEVLHNAADSTSGIKIMPCLSIPAGRANECGPLIVSGNFFRVGFDAPQEGAELIVMVENVEGNVYMSHAIPNGDMSRALEYLRKAMDMPRTMQAWITKESAYPRIFLAEDSAEAYAISQCSEYIRHGDILIGDAEKAVAILDEAWPVAFTKSHGEFHGDGSVDSARKVALNPGITTESLETVRRVADAIGAECLSLLSESAEEGSTAETPVTNEYLLSVIVDEITGAECDLGWVTLTLRPGATDAEVAQEYGRRYGTGSPRHGWESIIRVHASDR